MLNIIVLLSDNKSYREIFSDIFELDNIFYTEDEARYSRKCENGRYYFHYSKPTSVEYSAEELSQIPYEVSEICDITYYPPEMLKFIVSKLASYDPMLYIDDDHGRIMSINKYDKLINIHNPPN